MRIDNPDDSNGQQPALTLSDPPAARPTLPLVGRTLNLEEAAAFLHMHPEEVRTRTKRGIIPGAKTGRRWVFLEVDLAGFVRSLYPVRRQALQVTTSEEDVCHLSSARSRRSGGSILSRQMASEYADLLRPPTVKRRRSSTTS